MSTFWTRNFQLKRFAYAALSRAVPEEVEEKMENVDPGAHHEA